VSLTSDILINNVYTETTLCIVHGGNEHILYTAAVLASNGVHCFIFPPLCLA